MGRLSFFQSARPAFPLAWPASLSSLGRLLPRVPARTRRGRRPAPARMLQTPLVRPPSPRERVRARSRRHRRLPPATAVPYHCYRHVARARAPPSLPPARPPPLSPRPLPASNRASLSLLTLGPYPATAIGAGKLLELLARTNLPLAYKWDPSHSALLFVTAKQLQPLRPSSAASATTSLLSGRLCAAEQLALADPALPNPAYRSASPRPHLAPRPEIAPPRAFPASEHPRRRNAAVPPAVRHGKPTAEPHSPTRAPR
ncbi:hypothetical protein PVAP13_5KG104474 [Panicum virgatum]|uniref:Uncharacterized protein n=1 Tax=Panicum virgatum TaxID=38727 RepID=A0A8T0SGU1_PANVG|nr:hypothetical protein PVAP13_5KG104474 [Panicum virgatum]